MIYFMRDGSTGHIKIGHSVNPRNRLSQIRTNCPGEVELLATEPGGVAREAELHEQFATARQRGEWFAPDEALVAHIGTLEAAPQPGWAQLNTWGESGLTDDVLAEIVGVCRPHINRIRRGVHVPSLSVAVKIVEATGVPFASMLGPQPNYGAA